MDVIKTSTHELEEYSYASDSLPEPEVIQAMVYWEHELLQSRVKPTRRQKTGWVTLEVSPRLILFGFFGRENTCLGYAYISRDPYPGSEPIFHMLFEKNFCLLEDKEREFLRTQGRSPFDARMDNR